MKTGIQSAGRFIAHNLEAIIWIMVIAYFASSPVYSADHFTICPLKLAGFHYCPGCGLGRSMILLLHGHVSESFNMHPLALFAVVLLLIRIVVVFRNYFKLRLQLNQGVRMD